MDISLIIGGETKTFSSPFISGRMLRSTVDMASSEDMKVIDGALVDKMANYIVEIYGKQFTVDELLDGIASDQLIPTFRSTIEGVTGTLSGKLEKLKDPNAKRGKK